MLFPSAQVRYFVHFIAFQKNVCNAELSKLMYYGFIEQDIDLCWLQKQEGTWLKGPFVILLHSTSTSCATHIALPLRAQRNSRARYILSSPSLVLLNSYLLVVLPKVSIRLFVDSTLLGNIQGSKAGPKVFLISKARKSDFGMRSAPMCRR